MSGEDERGHAQSGNYRDGRGHAGGNSLGETWDALQGRAVRASTRITLFDPSPYEVQIAGEVKNFDNSSINPKEVRHMDRNVQFALVAGQEALRDCRLHDHARRTPTAPA